MALTPEQQRRMRMRRTNLLMAYAAFASSKAAAALSAPVNTAIPVISGTPTVGSTLTSSTGSWSASPTPTYAYQWKRGGVAIVGATSSTYVVDALDVGELITVTVTATNSQGSASATSDPVTGQAASAGNKLIWASGNNLTWGADALIWGT